ncbi:ABC transporter substrate-binding protein [Muriicola sp.]|uniref:ABC transporter substrate-binding protein n=1 Tax=Muriicola sp. TaxID=2020856 RepID=UPI003C721B71
MRFLLYFILLTGLYGCKNSVNSEHKQSIGFLANIEQRITYAKGFELHKTSDGITVITVISPWPGAETNFTYALVPKEIMADLVIDSSQFDAVIPVPVENLVVTSTTHIPALEALEVADRLYGFPGTDYISSEYTRERVSMGKVIDLGNNEMMNTEMTLRLNPELVVGFSISAENKTYETLKRSGIPVVYNGDWTEQTPLGKAEWIKFFAPFFQMEAKAEILFDSIARAYEHAAVLAQNATSRPSVMSGALYKDVWYAPGGNSWASQFIEDANAHYLWADTEETGSLSLSLESVLEKANQADFWVSPSQFTSYNELERANAHYLQFKPFQRKKVYTYASTKGDTGGLLFFELGPNRPDLILKDLIHIFHPEVLPEHTLFFFKSLQ